MRRCRGDGRVKSRASRRGIALPRTVLWLKCSGAPHTRDASSGRHTSESCCNRTGRAMEGVSVHFYQMWTWRLRPPILALLAVIWLPLWFAPAGSPPRAQLFDCGRARTAIETAICADASLKAQDAQLAQAYARLLTATQLREP